MQSVLPLILTAVVVLEGQALLETPSGARALPAGTALQDEAAAGRAQAVREKLLLEVGTWDLTVTQFTPDGERAASAEGVETCRAGPGDQWLLTETTIERGSSSIEILTVIGFHPLEGAYAGTLFDSFGGEPGLLEGTPTADLSTRTLQMYSAKGTPGFDARAIMTWEGENLRRTEFQVLRGGEWVPAREVVHRRRQ